MKKRKEEEEECEGKSYLDKMSVTDRSVDTILQKKISCLKVFIWLALIVLFKGLICSLFFLLTSEGQNVEEVEEAEDEQEAQEKLNTKGRQLHRRMAVSQMSLFCPLENCFYCIEL